MKAIDIRKSVRKYKNQNVENEKIEKILRAAMQAPSAGNQQSWEFIVVSENEKKEKISQMSPDSSGAKNAPYIIVVAGNEERMRFPENMQQDLGACTENILLEAVEQGLGTVWMSVYPQEDRIKCITDTLNLPEYIIPYSIVLLGYPLNEEDNKFVDRFDSHRIHYEEY